MLSTLGNLVIQSHTCVLNYFLSTVSNVMNCGPFNKKLPSYGFWLCHRIPRPYCYYLIVIQIRMLNTECACFIINVFIPHGGNLPQVQHNKVSTFNMYFWTSGRIFTLFRYRFCQSTSWDVNSCKHNEDKCTVVIHRYNFHRVCIL